MADLARLDATQAAEKRRRLFGNGQLSQGIEEVRGLGQQLLEGVGELTEEIRGLPIPISTRPQPARQQAKVTVDPAASPVTRPVAGPAPGMIRRLEHVSGVLQLAGVAGTRIMAVVYYAPTGTEGQNLRDMVAAETVAVATPANGGIAFTVPLFTPLLWRSGYDVTVLTEAGDAAGTIGFTRAFITLQFSDYPER